MVGEPSKLHSMKTRLWSLQGSRGPRVPPGARGYGPSGGTAGAAPTLVSCVHRRLLPAVWTWVDSVALAHWLARCWSRRSRRPHRKHDGAHSTSQSPHSWGPFWDTLGEVMAGRRTAGPRAGGKTMDLLLLFVASFLQLVGGVGNIQ